MTEASEDSAEKAHHRGGRAEKALSWWHTAPIDEAAETPKDFDDFDDSDDDAVGANTQEEPAEGDGVRASGGQWWQQGGSKGNYGGAKPWWSETVPGQMKAWPDYAPTLPPPDVPRDGAPTHPPPPPPPAWMQKKREKLIQEGKMLPMLAQGRGQTIPAFVAAMHAQDRKEAREAEQTKKQEEETIRVLAKKRPRPRRSWSS